MSEKGYWDIEISTILMMESPEKPTDKEIREYLECELHTGGLSESDFDIDRVYYYCFKN